MLLTAACLLEPGENYDSPRVRAEAGPWAMVALHALGRTNTHVRMVVSGMDEDDEE